MRWWVSVKYRESTPLQIISGNVHTSNRGTRLPAFWVRHPLLIEQRHLQQASKQASKHGTWAGVHYNSVLSLLVDSSCSRFTITLPLFLSFSFSSFSYCFVRLLFYYVQIHSFAPRIFDPTSARGHSTRSITRYHSLPSEGARTRAPTTHGDPEVLGLLGLQLLVSWPYTTSAVINASQGIP